MKDTKEIVLFFNKEDKFVPLDVAKEISERYPELGNPVIIPEMPNKSTPLIVFKENNEFQLQVTKNALTLVLCHNYFKNITTITFDMVDVFESFDVSFGRIGYIASNFLAPQYVEKAKERFLVSDNIGDVLDINLSWYRKVPIKDDYLNCWERIITDHDNFSDLLCQYDFNTPVNIEVNLEMKYIKEFFRVTDEYIEERVNF